MTLTETSICTTVLEGEMNVFAYFMCVTPYDPVNATLTGHHACLQLCNYAFVHAA